MHVFLKYPSIKTETHLKTQPKHILKTFIFMIFKPISKHKRFLKMLKKVYWCSSKPPQVASRSKILINSEHSGVYTYCVLTATMWFMWEVLNVTKSTLNVYNSYWWYRKYIHYNQQLNYIWLQDFTNNLSKLSLKEL